MKGKKIVITGAVGALGSYIAKELYDRGASLIICDIVEREQAESIIRENGMSPSGLLYKQADFTNFEEVEHLVNELFETNNAYDTAIGIIGGTPLQPLLETPVEDFRRIFELNFYTQYHLTKATARRWIEKKIPGHFIYTSSLVAKLPWPDLASYRSAKMALEAFSESVAVDLAPYRIRSNCVAPGSMAAGTALKVYEEDSAYRTIVDGTIPFGSLIDPTMLAKTYAWLAGDDAREINGQVIKVDRGQSLPLVGGIRT